MVEIELLSVTGCPHLMRHAELNKSLRRGIAGHSPRQRKGRWHIHRRPSMSTDEDVMDRLRFQRLPVGSTRDP